MEGITVENLSIGYGGEPLVEGLSLHMAEGEFWVIAGPNGTGKSTFIKTILGIIKPLKGRVLIHGKECSTDCPERRFLSYVPQMEDYTKEFPATTLDVVISGLFPQLHRFERVKSEHVETALYWLTQFGLLEVKDVPFNRLSGGQQRKTLIARALMGNPHYIFLDEPTTGVDLKSSRKILRLIDDLHKERGLGICMVTHDLNFVWNFMEKIILFGKHKFFVGSKEEILNDKFLSDIYGIHVKIINTEFGPVFLIGDKHI